MAGDVARAIITGVMAGPGSIAGAGAIVNAHETLKFNRSRMKSKMADLLAFRHDLQGTFRIYWFPRKQFDRWFKDVDELKGVVQQLAKSSKIKGNIDKFVPNKGLIANIIGVCTDIDKARQEGKELEDTLLKRNKRRIVKLATPINIATISTLKGKLEKLLECLKYKDINSIRLSGDLGTGKKVLLQHLNNDDAVADMFDIVFWCDNDYSTKGIQVIIARRLGLEIGDIEDENDIASKINGELNGARYLWLLNDVNEDFRPNTIGIPMDTEGSKIVYATSLPYVRPSGLFLNMEIGTLNKDDSFEMFKNILIQKNDTIQQPQIEDIAMKVADCCKGRFLYIMIVAENFKSYRSQQTWNDGLKMLKRPAMKEDIAMQLVENIWHVSYGDLEEKQKHCFLFTTLYPENNNIPIYSLVDCWTALNLLKSDVLESSSMTPQNTLEHFVAKGLLQPGSNEQYVKIDSVYRSAAMKMLKNHDVFKCLVAEKAHEELKKDNCKDIQWISLTNSEIDVLPDEIDCPELTTLFLQNNSKLKTISSSFFKKVNNLLILDLYKTGSEISLPMSDMPNLKVLYVNGRVMINELPFKIEGLNHKLEVLDIRGCIINEIPQDIEKLKRLRRLMMSMNESGTLPSVICKLSWLKELIVDVKLEGKVSYMARCNRVIANIIEKTETLKELTTLKICFGNHSVDVIQVMGDTLKIFVPKQASLHHILKERINASSPLQVYIGVQMAPHPEIPKYFKSYDNFVLSCDNIAHDAIIIEVLLKVKVLIMMRYNSEEHLDQSIVPHIQHCSLHGCNRIENFMQTDHSFSKLETLVLSECSQLKSVLLNDVVQNSQTIKYLEIRDCSAITKINMSSTSGGDILPTTLKTLLLHNLPLLEIIESGVMWPDLSTMEISKCPKLTNMPFNETTSVPNLRKIKAEKKWWEDLQIVSFKENFSRYVELSG